MQDVHGTGGARAAWTACFAALLLAVALFAGAHEALAGSVKDYAGDMVMLDAAGKVDSQSKMFFSGGKMRIEVPGQEGMGPMVFIMRPDRKVHWMIDVESKTYFEQVLDDKTMSRVTGMKDSGGNTVKEEQLGTETVSGYSTRKSRVTYSSKVMGKTHTSVMTVWKAEEFDVPLRERDEQGETQEFRNIVVGAQPASLFEVPKGYTKSKGMPGMPGMEMPDMKDMQNMPNMPNMKDMPGMMMPEGMGMPPGMKLPGQ